jgi:hypothetical protein
MTFLPVENTVSDYGQFKHDKSNVIIDFRHILEMGYYYKYNPKTNNNEKRFIRYEHNDCVISHWNKIEKSIGFWDKKTNYYLTIHTNLMRQPFTSNLVYWIEMDNNSVLPSCTLYYPNSGIIIHPNGTMDIINYE